MRKSLKLRVCGNVHPVNFCCSRIDVILLFYSCNDHGKVRKYIWQICVSASRQGFNRVALATICCASSVRLAARAAAVPPEDARNTAIVTMDTHLPLPAFTRELRKAFLRNQILVAAGLQPLPGFYLGGNLYRPCNGKAKHPGVLNPHGDAAV
jgi:hypothetical protein